MWLRVSLECFRLKTISDSGFRICEFGFANSDLILGFSEEDPRSKYETMTKAELKQRTKQFALRIIKVADALPKTTAGFVIGKQLIKAGTAVAANYRAACRGRSDAEFLSKITVVEEEADESLFWLEMVLESGMLSKKLLNDLVKEANELTAIFTSTGKTLKSKIQRSSK